MNTKELKRQIQGLAFEDESAMQEYKDIVNDAINRAVLEIHSTVRPILGVLEVAQMASNTKYVRYDMKELTKIEDKTMFMALDGKVMLDTGDNYITIFDCLVENRCELLVPSRYVGNLRIWYKKIPRLLTEETLDTEELELDYEVQILVPLLSSYYVWLDDDERKAVQYYNRYEDLRQPLMEKPTATINTKGGF